MANAKDIAGYNAPAKLFHWLSAIIVLSLLIVGFMMTEMAYSPEKLQLYSLHKSFGMLILGIGVMRLIWRFISASPTALPTHKAWEKALSKTIHLVLYISLIGMPLSGWIMSNAGEFPNIFFGLFEVPQLIGKDEALFKVTREIHEIFAFTLIAALSLHLAGALKHHIIDKDATLRRIGGNLLFALIGAALLGAAMFFAAQELLQHQAKTETATVTAPVEATLTEDAKAPQWVIDPDMSRIEFTFTQYGKNITGAFEGWDGTIHFSPDDLAGGAAKIKINTASIKTGSNDRDKQAAGKDWFASKQHPLAIYESKKFTQIGDNRYITEGSLTMRGQKHPLSFPFSLQINDNSAEMSAELTLNRLTLGIGQGEWNNDKTIGKDVTIKLFVKAQKKPK